ncbi:MAG: hypothetical protein JWQ47_829 [Glaciihabitans sp.]|nr:hypothetical protein [Glaciihabitans sp.]
MTRSHQRTSESHDPAHAIRRQARKGPWRVERGQFHIPTADGEQVILTGAAVGILLERIVRKYPRIHPRKALRTLTADAIHRRLAED